MPKKEIKNIIIESGSAKIRVECEDRNLLFKILTDSFIFSHIPSCRIYKNGAKKILPLLKIIKAKKFSVSLSYPKIICYQPSKIDIPGLIALIEYILERARNEKGVYSIHSSCIVKNDKAVIIFGGATNMGKTISAKAASDKFGWMFFCDEKTLIDAKKKKVVGGVKVASNCDRFDDFPLNGEREQADIAFLVYPHIDNSFKKISKWPRNKFFWHLNEELARKIRGASKAINFGSYPLQSLDTQDVATKRTRFAKMISKKILCYEVWGTPQQIARLINFQF